MCQRIDSSIKPYSLTYQQFWNDLIENNIKKWFIKYSNAEESLNNDSIFDKYKDFELLKFLSLRRRNEVYKLSGVNGNIKFLEEIINEVKEKGLF